MWKAPGRSTKAGVSRELFMERPSCELFWNHDGEFVNKDRLPCELFEMDAHLQECNHENSDRWSLEPSYAARHRQYLAHTVPQPRVGQATRNVGHGQHANGSREAPGGNEGRCGSTLRRSNAIMGGLEFNDGKKMATDGNGLDDDWTMVLEMCAREIVSLDGSGQSPPHGQHYKLLDRKITNSCMPRALMYLRDYPKVTLLGGPLSHTCLHRGNRVPELDNGSC